MKEIPKGLDNQTHRPYNQSNSQIISSKLATPRASVTTTECSKPQEVLLTILDVTVRTVAIAAPGRWLCCYSCLVVSVLPQTDRFTSVYIHTEDTHIYIWDTYVSHCYLIMPSAGHMHLASRLCSREAIHASIPNTCHLSLFVRQSTLAPPKNF